jgi:hypothetical protein
MLRGVTPLRVEAGRPGDQSGEHTGQQADGASIHFERLISEHDVPDLGHAWRMSQRKSLPVPREGRSSTFTVVHDHDHVHVHDYVSRRRNTTFPQAGCEGAHAANMHFSVACWCIIS